jgi:hypothetical protein
MANRTRKTEEAAAASINADAVAAQATEAAIIKAAADKQADAEALAFALGNKPAATPTQPQSLTEQLKDNQEQLAIFTECVNTLSDEERTNMAATIVKIAELQEAIIAAEIASRPANHHADECGPADQGLFGTRDENSTDCKDCIQAYAACAAACLEYKNWLAAQSGTKVAPNKVRQAAGSNNGTRVGIVRGRYQERHMRLNELGRPGAKNRALAEAIYNAGSSGMPVADYTTPGIALVPYVKYFCKEGFNVVIEGGRVYDRTVYAN